MDDDLAAGEEPVRRAEVAVGPHAIDGPRVEGAARERRADRIDELGDGAVGEALRKRVEDVRRHPDDARQEERGLASHAVGQGSGRHVEDEHGDQVGGEHRVDLEEIEAAAQQEQGVDGSDEPLRHRVAAENRVVGALGAGHGETFFIAVGPTPTQSSRLHARRPPVRRRDHVHVIAAHVPARREPHRHVQPGDLRIVGH